MYNVDVHSDRIVSTPREIEIIYSEFLVLR